MTHTVALETVSPRILAAVRRHVRVADIPTAFKPALDQVWAFVRSQPGLRTDGHNVFLYHHASDSPASGMDIDFGVEVTRHFPAEGDISCVETPACRAAVTVHRGSYSGLGVAHAALDRWCRDNGHRIGLRSWEIYGDWCDDESKLETTIVYALA
jgi:effector-binding domain-containing protein